MCGELLSQWQLPESLKVDGEYIPIRADFRDVIRVLSCLEDEDLPLFARWRKALRLFYKESVKPQNRQSAMEALCGFISCYRPGTPGPRLMSWQQDGQLIAGQINQVAGLEVRSLKFLHWWTFLGYFDAMGPGLFAQVVAIREKLRTGKKLDSSEQQFYEKNAAMIRLPESKAVQNEKMQLELLLKGGRNGTSI